MTIEREDYLEPVCPLEEPCGCGHDDCGHDHGYGSGPGAEFTHGNGAGDEPGMPHRNRPGRIPMREIIAECDRLFNLERPVELGEHLRKWREEARRIGDREGELFRRVDFICTASGDQRFIHDFIAFSRRHKGRSLMANP